MGQCFAPRNGPLTRAVAATTAAFLWLDRALRISRERRTLGALSDTALKDLGLTRSEAQREALRPFWDIDLRRG